MLTPSEALYSLRQMRRLRYAEVSTKTGGRLRVHILPSRFTLKRDAPVFVMLNGYHIVPIDLSWGILLAEFMRAPDADNWYAGIKHVYGSIDIERLRADLWQMLNIFDDIVNGRPIPDEFTPTTPSECEKYMRAPQRIDLMVSALAHAGEWNCNQKCLHCYAAGQRLSNQRELSTNEWKRVIDTCARVGIPQLTFTGGEPTLRDDLPELISHASWAITRLNTNGVLLTDALCTRLAEARLDSVQVTLYSNDPSIHNALVGAEHWSDTVAGIRAAHAAGLNVSVNTSLCSANRNYADTISFISALNVSSATCSALIPAGNAQAQPSLDMALTHDELLSALTPAVYNAKKLGLYIGFTSPGWLSAADVERLGLGGYPVCGACLSNMAIAPDGGVVPCQSWLSEPELGNILQQPWHSIWNNRRCRHIREKSASILKRCLLEDVPTQRKRGGVHQ